MLTKKNKIPMGRIALIGTAILVILALVIMGVIIGMLNGAIKTKEKKITELKDTLTHIKLQSEKDIDNLRMDFRKKLKEGKNEIEKMSAADIFNIFATDDEHNSKSDYLDGTFREQVRYLEQLLGEMGVFFAKEK